MFDRIAPRYDLLNRVLSGRRDVAWRRRMADDLRGRSALRLLDLATGTGDQILHLLDAGADLASAVGIDMSEEMLARGREKVRQRGLAARVDLRAGDATQVSFPDASFDAVTISFGIRNVGDVPLALREMRRVLRPGGRALILEFSLPTRTLVRAGYVFYLRHLLPGIGGVVSGDSSAYRYLNRTIEAFPSGEAFCALMREAGFVQVAAQPLTLGVATIYRGDAPSSA
ncbi:MAG: bifunctional demethylmenaquinone methyltransferase/2-methoxy-6-polyprenyl-1,4-benzoquinol methylase UbiE [Lentisphaerae bacterium]|nr:bifunctional demethylmenaquinone methyltransferase/2-methoxy-6-polyprenyl-1,4-benzoquinol methylase UbiE [Lentisphaerota bacterium]